MVNTWNGLPPMAPSTSAQMFGQVDVNRNGAPPNGIHADLRTPVSQVEQRAAPAAAAGMSGVVVLGTLALLYIALNAGRKAGRKK